MQPVERDLTSGISMYNQYKFTQAAIERSVEIVIYVLFQFTRPTRAVTLDRTEAGIDRVILIRTAYTAAIFIVQQTIRCLPFQIRTTPRVVIQRFHFCTVYIYFNSRDPTGVSNQLRVPSKTKPRIVAGFKTSCNGLDIFLEFQAPREAVHPESLNLCHSYVWEFR